MQHLINSAPSGPSVRPTEPPPSCDAASGDRSAHEVPDAQLWRDAIGAARRAAASAAELRQAFEAARPTRR